MPLYKLGKFILIRKLNSGGMAEIYLAKSFGLEGMQRLLAVKRILPKVSSSEDFIKMFIDEAKLASKLDHPNIAQIFELGREGNTYYIAMELVDGRDLRAVFDKLAKRDQHIPIPIVCKIIADVCEGLDYAHNKCDENGYSLNIVHRDVSLQNVLLSYSGQVKVIDFGVAKATIQSTETRSGVLKGKIGYMPPEQVAGQPVDCRGDIFACGAMLWELLTNCRLFKYPTEYQTLERVRLCEIYPPSAINPAVPPELEKIVIKALARDPDERYATAAALHDALLTYLVSKRQLPSTREMEQFMRENFAEEIAQSQAIFEEAQPITMETAGLIDMAEADKQRQQEANSTGRPRVVKNSEESRSSTSSHSVHQSGSQRSGTNYASNAMTFFGSGEEKEQANPTIQELSPEALKQLRATLGKNYDTRLESDVLSQPTLNSPLLSGNLSQIGENTAVNGRVMVQNVGPIAFFQGYSLKQKIFYGAVVIALLVCFGAVLSWLLAPSGVGSIMITTEPSGVQVGLDKDNNVCKSPCTLSHIESGNHRVIIFFPGLEPIVRKVKVKPNGLTEVRIP